VANLVVAAAACEALLGRALDPDAVRAGAAAARSPGRLEVVGAEPLVVLDGAHNRQGMEALAAALAEEFLPERWVVVFGARGPRDPADLIEPLLGRVALVIVTRPDDPSAIPTGTIAAGVRAAFGEDFPVEETSAVPEAIARALLAADGAGVVVCGSLYVVGEARAILAGDERTTSRIASEEERWR
jgi:dihydrofolate synthase/folylpolyglutamate synthase